MFFKKWRQRRKEKDALLRIIQLMQAEEEMVINYTVRQAEEKLRNMDHVEALRRINEREN